MYLSFYGLRREPFNITPDPDFLYLSPSHKEAFAAVMYGVAKRKGFVTLTGEVGTGKTTILRAYLRRIEKSDIQPIYLFNPSLTFHELQLFLLHEMGADIRRIRPASTLRCLHLALIQAYRRNRNIAFIIDEAQNMSVETLEKLRMLSNLETTKEKLLQVVLVGQPELDQKLNLHALRQLRQRIAVHCALRPLTQAESLGYIQHRLGQAGGNADIFDPAALKAIVRHAKGIPRTLNILCDNALINGYGYQQRPVTAKIVKEAASVVLARSGRPRFKRALKLAATVAVVVAVLLVAAGRHVITADRASTEVPRLAPIEAAPVQPREAAPVEFEPVVVATPDKGLQPLVPPPAEETAGEVAAPVDAEESRSALGMMATLGPDDSWALAVDLIAARRADWPREAATAPVDGGPPDVPQGEKEESAENAVEADAEGPYFGALTGTVEAAAAPTGFPVTRLVKEGDCLLRLVADVYGRDDEKVLMLVKESNPHIFDADRILVGDTLVFPEPANGLAAIRNDS